MYVHARSRRGVQGHGEQVRVRVLVSHFKQSPTFLALAVTPSNRWPFSTVDVDLQIFRLCRNNK